MVTGPKNNRADTGAGPHAAAVPSPLLARAGAVEATADPRGKGAAFGVPSHFGNPYREQRMLLAGRAFTDLGHVPVQALADTPLSAVPAEAPAFSAPDHFWRDVLKLNSAGQIVGGYALAVAGGQVFRIETAQMRRLGQGSKKVRAAEHLPDVEPALPAAQKPDAKQRKASVELPAPGKETLATVDGSATAEGTGSASFSRLRLLGASSTGPACEALMQVAARSSQGEPLLWRDPWEGAEYAERIGSEPNEAWQAVYALVPGREPQLSQIFAKLAAAGVEAAGLTAWESQLAATFRPASYAAAAVGARPAEVGYAPLNPPAASPTDSPAASPAASREDPPTASLAAAAAFTASASPTPPASVRVPALLYLEGPDLADLPTPGDVLLISEASGVGPESSPETHLETSPETYPETAPKNNPETGPASRAEPGPESCPGPHPEPHPEPGPETGTAPRTAVRACGEVVLAARDYEEGPLALALLDRASLAATRTTPVLVAPRATETNAIEASAIETSATETAELEETTSVTKTAELVPPAEMTQTAELVPGGEETQTAELAALAGQAQFSAWAEPVVWARPLPWLLSWQGRKTGAEDSSSRK
ncbi:Uncharacterised protein [Actinobaculum suis]|uniref:Uncharacterized protein n=1 Tax=Actinobaculum suis TaxID=1657 RepID=A0A7Z8Y8R4_9ACTO|nr:hypothetical protein [Actinobaculum suis]VDG75502.1 Uncharacterised protein [Actinobaculum suis]